MHTLGIILAGGKSTRLFPATNVTTKQLLPVYDKPLIYYPLSTLMLLRIRDFVIITNKEEQPLFKKLLSDELGINIAFAIQPEPNGIAESFKIARDYVDVSKFDKTTLILGDNIFYGSHMSMMFGELLADDAKDYGTIILKTVKGNEAYRFGVVSGYGSDGRIIEVVEKPKNYTEKTARMVTGLYFFPSDVYDKVYRVKPSARGELEITDLINLYLVEDRMDHMVLPRGMILYDTGTPDSLADATNFIRGLQDQGTMVGSPHEIAYRNGWITKEQLEVSCLKYEKSEYGSYLKELLW